MTKIDLPPIEDTIRHLREENADLRARFTERDMAAQYAESEERRLRIELAKVREVNAEQAAKITYQAAELAEADESWERIKAENETLREQLRQAQQRESDRLERNAKFAARVARSGE